MDFQENMFKSNFDELKLKVEAILFAAEAPLDAGEIRLWLGEVPLTDIRMVLRALSREYEHRAFELQEIENRYQLRTRPEYTDLLKKQHAGKARSLSKNALETLSIIAYRQPVTRAQINAIRQVDSASIVQSLKDKELIYVSGTRKEIGHPLEYRTTEKFLEIFGLRSLDDLPNLRSLQMTFHDQHLALAALKNAEQAPEGRLEEPSVDLETV